MKAKNKVGNCNTPCLTSRKSRLLAAVVWQQSLSVSAEQLVETVSLAIGVRVADYGGRQKCSWCVYALFLVSDQCHAVIWFKVNAFWAFFFQGGGGYLCGLCLSRWIFGRTQMDRLSRRASGLFYFPTKAFGWLRVLFWSDVTRLHTAAVTMSPVSSRVCSNVKKRNTIIQADFITAASGGHTVVSSVVVVESNQWLEKTRPSTYEWIV